MDRKFLSRFLAWGLCVLLLLGIGWDVKAAGASTNQENTSTSENYKIYVNRAANCVTVVILDDRGNETPVRAMACSCGRAGHETPTGVFSTTGYYEWCLMVDGTYGRYSVRFNNSILFHSVPYTAKSPDTLEWDQYNLLGEGASLGCVRLCVADAKWLYDNCQKGTPVVVYDDAKNPGPLGKPETTDISEDSIYKGWDPTDPDPYNPWSTILLNGVTYQNFDYERYAKDYPDVLAVYGMDKNLLWEHCIEFGVREGRTAHALSITETYENFDAKLYASRYPDLKAAFGTDKKLLWNHYINYGKAEGRIAF